MAEPILTDDLRKDLKKTFKRLKDDVVLAVFTDNSKNSEYNKIAIQMMKEFAEVDKRLKLQMHSLGDEASKKYNVTRSPTILVNPDRYNIRFTGAPLGEEGRTFVLALIMASTGLGLISEGAVERLKGLKEKRHVRIFVSPT